MRQKQLHDTFQKVSEKLQNESSPNFSNFRSEFCPEFCSEFSPNFLMGFRASFRGKRRPEKNHQKSPPFFNANSQANTEKTIHKMFLERRQSKDLVKVNLGGVVGGGRKLAVQKKARPSFPWRSFSSARKTSQSQRTFCPATVIIWKKTNNKIT